jgi:hypothetical protein
MLIMTLLIMTILITLNTGDITYNDLSLNWLDLNEYTYNNKKSICDVAFINVISKVFITIKIWLINDCTYSRK